MHITYTAALPEDASQVFLLCKQLIDDYEDTDAIDYDKVIAWVKQKLQKNITSYTRIIADGILAGWYSFDKETGELDDLYILPRFRGLGIGTTVIEKCIADSLNAVWLYVFKKNTGAISLYQRLGFSILQEVGSTRYIMKR